MRGYILSLRGKLDDAIADFDTALKISPGDANALLYKALCERAKARGETTVNQEDAATGSEQ